MRDTEIVKNRTYTYNFHFWQTITQRATATIYYTRLEYNTAINAAQDTKLRQITTNTSVHHKHNHRRTMNGNLFGGVNIMQVSR